MIDLRKTNYLLIIINIILIIVLVSGGIYFNSKFNSNPNTIINSKLNQSLEAKNEQVSAVESKLDIETYKTKHDEFSAAVESGSLNACNSLDESFYVKCKDSIYLNQAIEYSSPDLCEKISIEAMKMACKDLLIFN